jgi:hypothetical protein
VSERQISEITGRKVRTLQKDRLLGTGPFPFYRIARQILYDVDECLRIIEGAAGVAAFPAVNRIAPAILIRTTATELAW